MCSQLNRIEAKLNIKRIYDMSSQLDRIEEKLDKMLVQATENKANLKNHMKWDMHFYQGLGVIFGFVFMMHAVEASDYIQALLFS